MLSCSWCGGRSESEFDLLAVNAPAGGEWAIERWWHRSGCGRPVVLARNLVCGDAFALQPAGGLRLGATSVGSGGPVELFGAVEPVEPVESLAALEPVVPVMQVEPVGPLDAVEPVESRDSVELVESVEPVGPVGLIGSSAVAMPVADRSAGAAAPVVDRSSSTSALPDPPSDPSGPDDLIDLVEFEARELEERPAVLATGPSRAGASGSAAPVGVPSPLPVRIPASMRGPAAPVSSSPKAGATADGDDLSVERAKPTAGPVSESTAPPPVEVPAAPSVEAVPAAADDHDHPDEQPAPRAADDLPRADDELVSEAAGDPVRPDEEPASEAAGDSVRSGEEPAHGPASGAVQPDEEPVSGAADDVRRPDEEPAEDVRPADQESVAEVGVGDALTVAVTPGGGRAGFRWPRPVAEKGGASVTSLFSFNGIGARHRPQPADEEQPAPAGGTGSHPGSERHPDDGDEALTSRVAGDDAASGGTSAGKPSGQAEPVAGGPEAVDNRFRSLPRRVGPHAVNRPTATPVAGRAVLAPPAQEVDLTRRAPVSVVPRRPGTRSDAPASERGGEADEPESPPAPPPGRSLFRSVAAARGAAGSGGSGRRRTDDTAPAADVPDLVPGVAGSPEEQP